MSTAASSVNDWLGGYMSRLFNPKAATDAKSLAAQQSWAKTVQNDPVFKAMSGQLLKNLSKTPDQVNQELYASGLTASQVQALNHAVNLQNLQGQSEVAKGLTTHNTANMIERGAAQNKFDINTLDAKGRNAAQILGLQHGNEQLTLDKDLGSRKDYMAFAGAEADKDRQLLKSAQTTQLIGSILGGLATAALAFS